MIRKEMVIASVSVKGMKNRELAEFVREKGKTVRKLFVEEKDLGPRGSEIRKFLSTVEASMSALGNTYTGTIEI